MAARGAKAGKALKDAGRRIRVSVVGKNERSAQVAPLEFDSFAPDDPPIACKMRRSSLSSVCSVDNHAAGLGSRIKNSKMWDIIGMIMVGCLILLSMRVLVLKLTLVYFAGIFGWTDWNYKEWLLFLGFLNQLSGLALSGEVEMLRVLLFKFGGEDSKWTTENIEACDTYFHYLAYRTVEQLGRLKGIVLLFSLNSAQMQGLFQGHMRLKEQKAVRNKEIEMYQHLHDREGLIQMRDELLEVFHTMLRDHDRLLDEAAPEDKMDVLNKFQTKAIGALRLSAKAQEFIWEWEKVLLLEGAEVHDEDARRSKLHDDDSPAGRDLGGPSVKGSDPPAVLNLTCGDRAVEESLPV
jgi:hypothetical protein